MLGRYSVMCVITLLILIFFLTNEFSVAGPSQIYHKVTNMEHFYLRKQDNPQCDRRLNMKERT